MTPSLVTEFQHHLWACPSIYKYIYVLYLWSKCPHALAPWPLPLAFLQCPPAHVLWPEGPGIHALTLEGPGSRVPAQAALPFISSVTKECARPWGGRMSTLAWVRPMGDITTTGRPSIMGAKGETEC